MAVDAFADVIEAEVDKAHATKKAIVYDVAVEADAANEAAA